MQIGVFFIFSFVFILIFIWFVSFLFEKFEKSVSGGYRGFFIFMCVALGYPVWFISLLGNVKNIVSWQNAIINFLLFPIFLIVLGRLLQKLIQRSFKSKYYINLFPLFLILLCLSIFVLTVLVIKNTGYNNQIATVLALATGMFFASLFFSSKVISKCNDKIEKKVK